MPLISGVNHFITLQQAVDMTTKCREEKTDILKTEYQLGFVELLIFKLYTAVKTRFPR